MSGEDKAQSNESKSVSARLIGFYFALLAVFAPAFLQIFWAPPSTPSFQVWGMVWWLYNNMEQGGWHLDLSFSFFVSGQTPIYTLLRPVFVYQMVRYYQGKSSKKWTIAVGLAAELEVFVMNIPSMLTFLHLFLMLRLPIPFLLLAGILMMKITPRQEKPKLWLEKEESPTWWKPSNEDVE